MKEITLIGAGPGDPSLLTEQAFRKIREAQLLLGAERIVSPYAEGKRVFVGYKAQELAEEIRRADETKIAVLFSGDIGYHSGAEKLLPLLKEESVSLCGGISSLQYFCGKIGKPWQDVYSVSLHGKQGNLAEAVRRHKRVFVLTGGNTAELCRRLVKAQLGAAVVYVGENLSYETETCYVGTAQEAAELEFADLSVLLVENPDARDNVVFGLPDDAFERGEIPMTKSEVRSVSLSKMELHRDMVCWDIGSGTGSVTVELARNVRQVYAVEKHPSGVKLTNRNRERFGLENVELIAGAAPKALDALPAPDAVFIGGSGGSLREILSVIFWKNPRARIVMNVISLETLSEVTALCKTMLIEDFSLTQVQVSRSEEAGAHHLMKAQNPVFVISFRGKVDE